MAVAAVVFAPRNPATTPGGVVVFTFIGPGGATLQTAGLVGGMARASFTGLRPGAYTIAAEFPAASGLQASVASGSVTIASPTTSPVVPPATPPTVPVVVPSAPLPGSPPISPPVWPPVSPPATLVRELAVGGTGCGSARLLNPDRSERFTDTPFPGFTGGVRTATADFERDGVADLAAGTRTGKATRVVVLDGTTQTDLFALNPFEANFTGGVYVAASDINGDGVADLAITPDGGRAADASVLGCRIRPSRRLLRDQRPELPGSARPALGDMDGDSFADPIIAAGFGGEPRIAVFCGAKLAAEGSLPGDQQTSDR